MNDTAIEFKNYIFDSSYDEAARLQFQYKMFQPHFIEMAKRILGEFGLAEYISANPEGIRIIDVGCSEGLYLHDLATLIENTGLKGKTSLYGIDINPGSIATAEAYSQQVGRSYLQFYTHDLTQPFEKSHGLLLDLEHPERAVKSGEKLEYGLIYSNLVLMHVANARFHIERLYELLKPGGVLYLRDIVVTEGKADGWTNGSTYTQNIQVLGNIVMKLLSSPNPTEDVALKSEEWLRAAGAEILLAQPDLYPVGGNTPVGRGLLRDFVMVCRNVGPMLVARNVISQQLLDDTMNDMFVSFTPQADGQFAFRDTVVRKPLT